MNEIVMDHVAVASANAWDNLIRYGYQLGGRWLGGPDNDPERTDTGGFYFCQVEFARGARIEILEAIPGEGSDFIRRFLARNGPGPHHYTFKVPDFDAAVEQVRSLGYDIVGERADNPDWMEAFLHPKQSHGIVIQLAHQGAGSGGWVDATPLPPSPRNEIASLDRCVHLVADLSSATELFTKALDMSIVEEGNDGVGSYVELASGAFRLQLVNPTDAELGHWLGDRTGRLHHVAFSLDEPGTVPDARPIGAGRYEIPPEQNLGLRLRLQSPS
ncbi:MAG: VOC family protein [Acidimicrobiales bacterium]